MSNTDTVGGKSGPLRVLLIGAGNRGHSYAQYAKSFPDRMKVVGVADCREFRRNREQKDFNIPAENVYSDWRELTGRERFGDIAIIATHDQEHKAPVVAMARKGYHILLEKPMATTEEDCREIVRVCQESAVILAVCHVLKYSPQARTIKQLIDTGAIGQVVNIQHLEPIGHWHFGHSYVRGNWRREDTSSSCLLAKSCHDLDLISYWLGDSKCVNVSSFGKLLHFTKENKIGHWHFAHAFVRGNWRREDTSSFSLMTKSCHDLDLISYWMGDSKCVNVSSFGKLLHFTKENKPAGAADRCLDCSVEKDCPYSSVRLYMNKIKQGHTGWPVNVIVDVPDIESVAEALRTGPYGRCVYNCDNDVVSHQVVNMQFDKGQTVSFTMVAFTDSTCVREVKVHGTMGEITCNFDGPVYQYDFRTRKTVKHMPSSKAPPGVLSGHGGADYHTMESFLSAVQNNDPSLLSTGAEESLRSHLMVFAAEKARRENKVLTVNI